MAKPRGIRRVAQVQPIRTGNATTDRATGEVVTKVNALARNAVAQAIPMPVDLEWGLNKIGHGLGVPVRYFWAAAVSDPDASITSAQDDNPVPDKQVWVQLDGQAAVSTVLFLLPQVT